MSEKLGWAGLIGGILASLLLWHPFSLAMREWQQQRWLAAQNREKLSRLETLSQAKANLSAKYETVSRLLVQGEAGVAAVAAGIESAAENSAAGLTLTLDDFPEKTELGGVTQISLGIKAELEGSYQSIVSWETAVERLPYLIRWEEMKLGQSRQPGMIKAEFDGVIYLEE